MCPHLGWTQQGWRAEGSLCRVTGTDPEADPEGERLALAVTGVARGLSSQLASLYPAGGLPRQPAHHSPATREWRSVSPPTLHSRGQGAWPQEKGRKRTFRGPTCPTRAPNAAATRLRSSAPGPEAAWGFRPARGPVSLRFRSVGLCSLASTPSRMPLRPARERPASHRASLWLWQTQARASHRAYPRGAGSRLSQRSWLIKGTLKPGMSLGGPRPCSPALQSGRKPCVMSFRLSLAGPCSEHHSAATR